MQRPRLKQIFPDWTNATLALIAAAMLALSFPDFELWWIAWIALIPLMFAIEREKASILRSSITGWIFGTVFFFGTCWWLAYAPIHYAGFPPILAYSLVFIATLVAGIFPAIFGGILAVLLRRFGSLAFLAAPFVWVFSEFLRYWLTGNNWNAIGYSQAFQHSFFFAVSIGGVMAASFCTASISSLISYVLFGTAVKHRVLIAIGASALVVAANLYLSADYGPRLKREFPEGPNTVFAIQSNVPMSGLDSRKLEALRQRQIDLAETEIAKLRSTNSEQPTTVILPESPMNFMYNDDREFQHFIGDFARRNNVSVLFNSAEPDKTNGKYFNAAVMVGPEGREIGEYDKIYLLPFGEAVPPFLEGIVPGFVGNFSYGRNYDLLPVGDAKAGVMICFESHFGQLSRHYAANGADVIIEMTNDGYLGPTPVLRQHLANAVFRAVETNRPVLRVTNVGVTAYINARGEVVDPAPTYAEATRVWSVSKSDGSQTFYVRFGDWFAWLCSAVTIMLLGYSAMRRKRQLLNPEISDN
ncbi:MAG: apolipoprotein N-acyltransferase [Acidobacteriota bacterium]